MKQKLFFFLTVFFLVSGAIAQVPEKIKPRLDKLITEADKQVGENPQEVKSKIAKFIRNAPNKQASLATLKYIRENSQSEGVRKIVTDLIRKRKAPKKKPIVLKNATIIDAVSDAGRTGSLLIKGDRIVAIDYSGEKDFPGNAIVYDLDGKYMIPGIIDGHVHITHGTAKKAEKNLNIALRNGVTGVRDMGGDARVLTGLKRAMQIGETQGADVFFGNIIAGPEFFEADKKPQSVAKGAIAGEVPWQRAITSDTDFKQIVAEVKGTGATAIKCYANLDKDVLKAVSDEAKKQGLKVWGHAALHPTRPTEVINAGIEVISHASMLNTELVDKLIAKTSLKNEEELKAYMEMEKEKSLSWDENNTTMQKLFRLMKTKNTILDATLFLYTIRLNKANPDSTKLKNSFKIVSFPELVFLLMQHMQKDLTRTGAKGIGITFRVSQFQEIAFDKHSHPAREVKIKDEICNTS